MAETTVKNPNRNVARISKADAAHVRKSLADICKGISELNSDLFKEIGGAPQAGIPVSCSVKFEDVSDELKSELIGYATRIAHNWAWLNKTLNALFLEPNVESTTEPPPDPPGDGKP